MGQKLIHILIKDIINLAKDDTCGVTLKLQTYPGHLFLGKG